MKKITQKTMQSFAAIVLVLGSSSFAQAGMLDGQGNHLFIDSSTPANPDMQVWALSHVVAGTSFVAGWSSPALSPWIGLFSATGSIPGGVNSRVDTRMNFTTMPGGVLASGTFFNFSDLDSGSGSERFTFRAFDAENHIIKDDNAWLDDVIGVSGFGSNGGTPDILDMPSWNWDPNSGEYTFIGNSLGGVNPNMTITLSSNMAISYLEVERTSNNAGFNLGAPVPTPGTASLLALGGLMISKRRRG